MRTGAHPARNTAFEDIGRVSGGGSRVDDIQDADGRGEEGVPERVRPDVLH